MPFEPPTMKCPTCGATQQPSPECRRCRCDLSLVLAAIAREESLRDEVLRRLASGEYGAATDAARRLHADFPSDKSLRWLGVGQLLSGDYDAALATCDAAITRMAREE